MFLKKFKLIAESGRVIREVVFKKGINIILGEQESEASKSSNSLGKTTLIRCIDFCLGAKNADEIYTDTEFRTPNHTVETFLKQEKPTFYLSLSHQFESDEEIIIQRKLDLTLTRKKITNSINGETYSKEDFESELKKILFDFYDNKPTLRQLIGKFIRKRDDQIGNILRFNGHYCTQAEYEKIHLFLMGFESKGLLTEKADIENKIRETENILKSLESRNSVSALSQRLYLIQSETEELKKQRDAFQISEKYTEEAEQLEQIQIQLKQNEQELSALRLKAHTAQERISYLKNDSVSLTSQTLQYLYQEAEFYNEKLAHTFDSVVRFHNTMLGNEIASLEKMVENSLSLQEELELQRIAWIEKYNSLLLRLGQSGSLQEYSKLNDQIAANAEEIGRITSLLDEIRHHTEELENLKEKQKKLTEKIQTLVPALDENLRIFNQYFSKYTQQLTGAKYLLAYSIERDIYKFKIDEFRSHAGAGEKQAVVIAFDLAYMAFCNEIRLKRPLFATQDKIEVIDIGKLTELFTLANEQNGQIIAPVIHDKVTDYPLLTEDTVLRLSAKNKFFCIED